MPDHPHGPSATLQRIPERGSYDTATIHAIIDACPVASIGIADTAGPVVIPSIVWRIGNELFTHGAQASRLMRALAGGARTCLVFTRLDGLVLARSAFNHSMNYRSAVVFGQGAPILDRQEKVRVLDALLEWLVPGRSALVRAPTQGELDATTVIRIPISEASAKISAGEPEDPPADRALPVWAGVIPRRETWGQPVPAADCPAGLPAPARFGAG